MAAGLKHLTGNPRTAARARREAQLQARSTLDAGTSDRTFAIGDDSRFGTVTPVDDTTTNLTFYPVFVSGASSGISPKICTTRWTFNPSSGVLIVTAITSTFTGNLTGNVTGNADTATKLATARTLGMTGDLTWTSPSFDGSGNVTAAGTLATVNSNVGNFGSATQVATFTVNAKGLTTAAANVTVTPAVGSITGLGTGVATALAVNVGSAGAFVTFNGAGGTPSSLTLTNATGYVIPSATVTLAMMANMATSSLIYRKTAGSGAPEVNTLATLKTDLGLTGTNSGDQTITLTGGVTGSGTGSFAATVVTNANLTGDVTSVGNATTIGAGKVTEAMQVLADNTTNNVSTSKHGYVPKLTNDATKFFNDQGVMAVPAGAGYTSSDASATISGTDLILNANWLDGYALINGYLSCSVAASALTIAIKNKAGNDPSSANPVKVIFRNATVATGDYTVITLTAATSLVISSGSTMGATSSVAFRLWVVGINDGGTFRLGAINCLSGTNIFPLRDSTLYSTSAEGGAGTADLAQVIYTGTAATQMPSRILGLLEWVTGLTAAGTWSIVPTTVQAFGFGVSLPGSIVQMAISTDGASASGTTTTPADNTIPQNTEGTQFMSLAISGSNGCNVYVVDSQFFGSASAVVAMIMALHRDSVANALKTGWRNINAINAAHDICLHCEVQVPGSSTTFKIRVGGSSASTIYFNDNSVGGYFNGTFGSYLRVQEIMG